MSANALRVVSDFDVASSDSENVDDTGTLPDLRPSYDLQGDPKACRWFGGIVVEFASRGEPAPGLHPAMVYTINSSLAGRHPRHIYDQGTMYLTFRLLSLAERPLVEEFADSLESWLGRTAARRVFEHGPIQSAEAASGGSVTKLR